MCRRIHSLLLLSAIISVLLSSCNCDDDIGASFARLAVEPGNIDFGEHTVNDAVCMDLKLISTGTINLEFKEVRFLDEVFFGENMPETGSFLAPGESLDTGVCFLSGEEAKYESYLIIDTNDSDETRLKLAGETLSPAIRLCHGVDDPDTDEPDCAPSGESLFVDFGQVIHGEVSTRKILIGNKGRGRLVLQDVNIDDIEDKGFITDYEFSPVNIPRGGGLEIEFSYTGDSGGMPEGKLTIKSNDPAYPESYVFLSAEGLLNNPPSACAAALRREGIDGIIHEFPEPRVEVEANPRDRIFLTAHPYDDCSFDVEDGRDLRYQWIISQQPEGENAVINNDRSGPSPDIYPPQPEPSIDIGGIGIYKVELIVFDSFDEASVPAEIIINAVPDDDLIIELKWHSGADLDLHLIAPGQGTVSDRLYCDPLDCFWGTCRPDNEGIPTLHWGSVNNAIGNDGSPETDPILRFDNFGDSILRGTTDTRLETITLKNAPSVDPLLGPYLIGVGLFDARGVEEAFDAVVTVIHSGEILFSAEREFLPSETDYFWLAGSFDAETGTGNILTEIINFPYPGQNSSCDP